MMMVEHWNAWNDDGDMVTWTRHQLALNRDTRFPHSTCRLQMSTFSTQPVVIDGKGHLLGRLASIIAKQVSQLS